MKTKQEIFDIVVEHARTQNKKSMDNTGRCLYLNGEGNKCFIGLLIPQGKYHTDFEGKSAMVVLNDIDFKTDIQRFFFEDLQKIHDDFEPDSWEKEFKEFAKMYNLTYYP